MVPVLPTRDSSEWWAWIPGKRVEIETIDDHRQELRAARRTLVSFVDTDGGMEWPGDE